MSGPPISVPDPQALRGTLRGERVVLEPLRAEHGAGLGAAATDPEMFRWLMGLDLTVAEVRDAWLDDAVAAGDAGREVPYAILEAGSGRVLGTTRFLALQLGDLVAEIGWTWLTRAAWGTGVNVEAKLLLLTRAFEVAGLRRVEFKTDARNDRSRGALTALGARYEGTFRKHRLLPDGSSRDSAYFSVTDDDWPALRTTLQRRLKGRDA